VALAFSEACNSLLGPDPPHEGVPGPLMIQAWRDADEIAVRVSHGAHGAGSVPVGVGYGFGLALMARICDRFEVRRRESRPGTAVEMAFRLGPAREPERSFPLRPSRSTTRR
jgi:hypothetical protein